MTKKFKIPKYLKDQYDTIEKRKKVLKKCGKDAFLDPKNLKYPVFNADKCEYDYRLVHAAYVRSIQWKQNTITRKASKILKGIIKSF